jgi:Aspartyl protease
MPFFLCILLATLLLPLSGKSEAQREIHSQYQGGLIWLKVDVTGKSEPLNFLLDSGAGISVIDLQTARGLGVHLGNRQMVQGVNGQGIAYCVNDLQAGCGGIALPKSVLAVDLRALSGCCESLSMGFWASTFSAAISCKSISPRAESGYWESAIQSSQTARYFRSKCATMHSASQCESPEIQPSG